MKGYHERGDQESIDDIMIKLFGISGSLRKESFNKSLLQAAAQVLPDGCSLELGTINGIPLYNADVESAEGVPDAATQLKEKIAQSDGLILATPEYNNSIPGVFKNAIDWLSRPPQDQARVFYNHPVGLIGTTPGSFGTAFSQTAWLPTLRLLKMNIWFGEMLWVGSAMKVFDSDGNLVDERTKKQLTKYMEGFYRFVSK